MIHPPIIADTAGRRHVWWRVRTRVDDVTSTPAASDPDSILAALHRSHDRLEAAALPLTALSTEEVTQSAYPTEWSIADVLSHLGSGAEIFTELLSAALTSSPPPGQEEFVAIWDVWNAKTPLAQVTDALVTDAAFLAAVDATTPEERAAFGVEMFNGPKDLAGFLLMRLGEHAVHTWDVRVALDPSEGLPSDAAELILTTVPGLVGFAAHPTRDLDIAVHTSDPDRDLLLALRTEGSSLTEAAQTDAAARLRLPAEAFVRLLYGRLDADHTPAVDADGVDLDELRQAFPGF